MYVYGNTNAMVCRGVRRQLAGEDSSWVSPCTIWGLGLNSGRRAWCWVPLPSEPPHLLLHQSFNYILKNLRHAYLLQLHPWILNAGKPCACCSECEGEALCALLKHLSVENRLLSVLPGLLFPLQLRSNCLVTYKPRSYPLNGESDWLVRKAPVGLWRIGASALQPEVHASVHAVIFLVGTWTCSMCGACKRLLKSGQG